MSDEFDAIKKLPIWKEKYEKMGVTPRELYMRQNGLCWPVAEVSPDGTAKIFCTDGKDKAETARMLNPTVECAQCMATFAARVVEGAVESGAIKNED